MVSGSSRRVCVIDPIADPRWYGLISSHGSACFFHHPAWLTLIAHHYKFKTFALCIEQAGGLIGGIPFCEVGGPPLVRKKWVCLPFSDYCGPLARSPDDSKYLVDHAIARAESLGIRLEIREALGSESGCETSSDHWLHVLELELELEPERLLKQFKSVVQR